MFNALSAHNALKRFPQIELHLLPSLHVLHSVIQGRFIYTPVEDTSVLSSLIRLSCFL